jgi:hypothetical protein
MITCDLIARNDGMPNFLQFVCGALDSVPRHRNWFLGSENRIFFLLLFNQLSPIEIAESST